MMKMSSTSLTVHVNSVELEQVQSHKLSGVIIDTQLNFNEHIDNLCKKLTQRIAVLKKIRRYNYFIIYMYLCLFLICFEGHEFISILYCQVPPSKMVSGEERCVTSLRTAV